MKYGDLSKKRADSVIQYVSNAFSNELSDLNISVKLADLKIHTPDADSIKQYQDNIKPKIMQFYNNVDPNDANSMADAKKKVKNYLNKIYKNERYFKIKIVVTCKSTDNKGGGSENKSKIKPTNPPKCKTNVCKYQSKKQKKRLNRNKYYKKALKKRK